MSNNNFVTIGYLKEFTKGVIKINQKGSSLSNDYIVTYNEIVNGNFFTYFKDNEFNPKSIITGLYIPYNDTTSEFVKIENIQLIFPKMMSLIINCDDVYISPCGGSVELNTFANINLMARTNNGEYVIRKINYLVNPILRKENNEFKLEKHTVSIEGNIGNENRSTMITASYSFRNVLKNASIEIIQESNELSDWIFDYNSTDSISISASETVFSNEGGTSTLTVKRTYTSHYYKEDSCGNKIATSAVTGNHDDISRICQYDSTNTSIFKRNSNIITVDKQSVDAAERFCIVFVEYDGFNDSITLKQEKGSSSSYDYTLKFMNEGEFAVRCLTTSKPTEFTIPLISTTNLYINNKYINSIPYYDLKFVKYDDWYDVNLDDEDDEISIVVHIKEPNTSKDFDRESELEIYIANDITNRIKLLIKQPKNKLLNTEYRLLVDGDKCFNADTIKNSKIEFKPLKIETYEDGSIKESRCLDEGYKLVTNWYSSDNSVLDGRLPKLINFDGTHIMKPIYRNIEVPYDVTLCVISYITDSKNLNITNKNTFNIILKSINVTTYEYIFTYKDNSSYKELEWEYNDFENKFVDVICKKQHYIDGEFDCEYEIPFNYKLNDDNLDINFSVNINKCDDNVEKFFIYPNMENDSEEDVIKQYTLIQHESDKELQLNLIQHPKSKDTHKNIELNVSVHKNDIGDDDFWTDEETVMFVIDVTDEENTTLIKEIPLNKCWLYDGIDNNADIVYDGIIDLIVGHKYKFKTEGFVAIQTTKGEIYNTIFTETYEIEDDDEGLELVIEI